uniref:Ig-like domain-containing protein n=1 Tax=Poecilia formosa TaxID=48698 RepID=A0A087YEK5_POEFO
MDNPTGRTTLDVYEPVSNVRVSTLNTDLIEFNSSINLSCSSSGRSLSFIWMKNNSEVTTNDRVQITTNGENSNLTIVNVTRNDQGSYSCNVSNPVSSVISAPVNISVYYGPEKTNLRSPSQKYPEGSNIHLSCSADSRPNASFNWFFNGNDLPHSESQRKLLNVQKNQSGNYSCQAFNSRTSKYEISQISVIYIEDISTEGSIHPGAIAGIVIGCVVCISLIVLGVYFILKKKKQGTTSNRNISTDGNRQANAANNNEEVNYADVKFSKKNVQAQWESDHPSPTYADIRMNRN